MLIRGVRDEIALLRRSWGLGKSTAVILSKYRGIFKRVSTYARLETAAKTQPICVLNIQSKACKIFVLAVCNPSMTPSERMLQVFTS
jgi:hypothetical protein